MKDGHLERIKSRGYWRINFEPVVDIQKFKTLTECKNAVVNNAVQFRGWDYPHIPRRMDDGDGMAPGDNFYEGWIDWWSHIELWRMYQSGQFLHYFAIHEDWLKEEGWDQLLGRAQGVPPVEPMQVLDVIGGITYQLTEIFQFLSRLVASGIYDEGVRVSISAHKTKGRRLWMSGPGRHLKDGYKTQADEINFIHTFTREEVLTKPKECALKVILHVLERFGWDDPSVSMLDQDQENLINRRFY